MFRFHTTLPAVHAPPDRGSVDEAIVHELGAGLAQAALLLVAAAHHLTGATRPRTAGAPGAVAHRSTALDREVERERVGREKRGGRRKRNTVVDPGEETTEHDEETAISGAEKWLRSFARVVSRMRSKQIGITDSNRKPMRIHQTRVRLPDD